MTGTGLLNAPKDTRQSWDIERSLWCGGRVEWFLVPQKRRGNNLCSWAQKDRNSEWWFGISIIRATKNRAWWTERQFKRIWNPQDEKHVTPKAPELTDYTKHFPRHVFHCAVIKTQIHKTPANNDYSSSTTELELPALYTKSLYVFDEERNCLDSINLHTS